MANVIGHVVEIDRASERLAGSQELWNLWTLHEPIAGFGAPTVRGDFVETNPLDRPPPRHRQNTDSQNEQMLMQSAVVLDVPNHHGRRILRRAGQKHCCSSYAWKP